MSNEVILILGARSDIAMAVAHRFANACYNIQLAARNVENLADVKSDIELRYDVSVTLHEFDVLEIKSHKVFVENLNCLPTVVVCSVGYMGSQLESEKSTEAASVVVRTNFEGPASILGLLANYFELRGSGCLVGISSVAGERGRASNYVYGSAKAGFTAFLSGLRNRLAKNGVRVITVLPGYVATQMTEDLQLPPLLTASSDAVASAIFTAVNKNKDIVYVKPIWKLIMALISNIPEFIFKNMKI